MRLLITGAGGFFGRNLLDEVAGRDDIAVHALGRSRHETPAGAETVWHQVDLFDRDAVDLIMTEVEPTHLCHLAWLGPEHADRYNSPRNQDWVEASDGLYRSFAHHGGRRVVHLGSCIEYGSRTEGTLAEDRPTTPDTAYARAKVELADRLTGLAAEQPDLSAAVARPFFAYGPHEQPARLVPAIINALTAGEPLDLTEGRQRRDYLHSADIARALLALLDGDRTGPFNIGSGCGVEVRAIAEQLGNLLGRPELLRFGARPEGSDTSAEIVADITRITTTTGWRPEIGLEHGLADTVRWWQARPER